MAALRTLLLPILSGILASLSPGQAGTVPPGYLSTAANQPTDFAWKLGSYQNTRAQISSSGWTKLGARLLSRISFRQDEGQVSPDSGGRSFRDVELQMAETDMSQLSSYWTQNFLRTPTTVFRGTQSWPDLTQRPSQLPAPWSQGGLAFPFATPWTYSGQRDLLLDLRLEGGTLANGAAWGSSAAAPRMYYLDAISNLTQIQAGIRASGLNVQAHSCAQDSGRTGGGITGPGAFFEGVMYAKITGNPNTDDRFGYRFRVTDFPAQTVVLQALSLGGTLQFGNPGYPVVPGLGCQNLMVDLSRLLTVQRFTTDRTGAASSGALTLAPFHPALPGLKLYSQAIWSDTLTSAAKLSRVSETTLPPQPAGIRFAGRFSYTYTAGASWGFLATDSRVPVYRFD